MAEVMVFECPKCNQIIFLGGAPKFCMICGSKLENKDIKTLTLPMCPPEIPKGHCEECRKGKYKKCDDCGSTEAVEYCPQRRDKCLCLHCRELQATLESLSRSW